MALVVGCVPDELGVERADYHFFRRNNDMFWSHKPGGCPASDVDNSGNAIVDPEPLVFSSLATAYDKFCGYFKYDEEEVEVLDEIAAVDFGLVDLPPDTVEIVVTGTSGIPYGWRTTEKSQIDNLVGIHLTGLTEVPEPAEGLAECDGFFLMAEAGVLPEVSGLWKDSDEVLLAVCDGIIEVVTYAGNPEDVHVSWYTDSANLLAFLVSEAGTLLHALEPPPLCGDGFLDGLEDCDDGNAIGDDGCDSTCEVEPGFSCQGEPSVCFPEGIPAVSQWGVAVMVLLLLGAGTLVLSRRRIRSSC